jgi:hypothetical protein
MASICSRSIIGGIALDGLLAAERRVDLGELPPMRGGGTADPQTPAYGFFAWRTIDANWSSGKRTLTAFSRWRLGRRKNDERSSHGRKAAHKEPACPPDLRLMRLGDIPAAGHRPTRTATTLLITSQGAVR